MKNGPGVTRIGLSLTNDGVEVARLKCLVPDELMDRSSEDRGSGEDDLETLDPDALESRETRKRKRDGLDDSDDEDDELDAKHLKSEDLGISSSSSDVDSHEFSDDEDTLGEMARDLDRALQEE